MGLRDVTPRLGSILNVMRLGNTTITSSYRLNRHYSNLGRKAPNRMDREISNQIWLAIRAQVQLLLGGRITSKLAVSDNLAHLTPVVKWSRAYSAPMS